MSAGERFAAITPQAMQDYIDSESREAELESSDFDDEIIEDEPLTISEILNSATLKLELCQHIGASNWARWKKGSA